MIKSGVGYSSDCRKKYNGEKKSLSGSFSLFLTFIRTCFMNEQSAGFGMHFLHVNSCQIPENRR